MAVRPDRAPVSALIPKCRREQNDRHYSECSFDQDRRGKPPWNHPMGVCTADSVPGSGVIRHLELEFPELGFMKAFRSAVHEEVILQALLL